MSALSRSLGETPSLLEFDIRLSNSKNSRLELRASSDVKEKIKSAAELAGLDMSAFILMVAQREAQKVIDAQKQKMLSLEEWDNLDKLLASSTERNDAICHFMKRKFTNVRRKM